MAQTHCSPDPASLRNQRSVATYAAPIAVFGVLTALEQYLPPRWYPAFYVAKIAAVTAALLYFRGPLGDIRPARRDVALSMMVGGVIIVQWVLIDRYVPYPHLGTRVAFDPFAAIDVPWARWTFLAARIYGLALVVPVMEELFWRSFLLRYATTPAFTSLPIGQFSALAFGIMVALSALTHPEWLVAGVASALFAWALRRTRSVFAAVVSHAVANAALGAYVLATGEWHLW